MNRIQAGALALAGAVSGAAGGQYLDLHLPLDPLYVVERTVDGDTLSLAPFTDAQQLFWSPRGEQEAVRLLCVSAPERGEPGSLEAADWLEARVGKRAISLDPAGPARRDHFGRVLAFVSVDGTNVGLELVRTGLAKVYRKRPCPEADLFDEAEAQARNAHRGLWAPAE